MRAGIETLKRLASDPNNYKELERKSQKLVDGILAAAKANGHAACGDCAGGMFGFFFCEGPVKAFSDAENADAAKFGRWHRAMLERGVYLAPSTYEAGFMSLAHTDADIEQTIAIAEEVMKII